MFGKVSHVRVHQNQTGIHSQSRWECWNIVIPPEMQPQTNFTERTVLPSYQQQPDLWLTVKWVGTRYLSDDWYRTTEPLAHDLPTSGHLNCEPRVVGKPLRARRLRLIMIRLLREKNCRYDLLIKLLVHWIINWSLCDYWILICTSESIIGCPVGRPIMGARCLHWSLPSLWLEPASQTGSIRPHGSDKKTHRHFMNSSKAFKKPLKTAFFSKWLQTTQTGYGPR